MRQNDPSTYLRIFATVTPKELVISRPFEELSDEQLATAMAVVTELLAQKVKEEGGAEPHTIN